MRPLLSAWLYERDGGDVEWTVRSHPLAEAGGLAPVVAGGVVHKSDTDDTFGFDPEDVGIALSIVAARLIRLADSAAWSHNLF
jgi:hypothetical protein